MKDFFFCFRRREIYNSMNYFPVLIFVIIILIIIFTVGLKKPSFYPIGQNNQTNYKNIDG